MREDNANPGQRPLAPSLNLLHVLHVEGLDKPDSRRDFAEYCDLDPSILESNFVTNHLEWRGTENLEDDFKPSMLAPIIEREVAEDGEAVLPLDN
ncbi:hypothetical protein N0V82_007372 [Gnomoniopsis sp. IMI 355080]|nr:hypothetical protein N0V82_007372 [Gnomoniopsis sp. IMI 355080]